MRKSRFWIVVVLTCINSNLLFHAVHDKLREPSSATLIGLSEDQVRVAQSTKGEKVCVVTVPLDDPRFRAELNQTQPTDFLVALLINLTLLLAVLYCYWQESRASTAAKQPEPNAEWPQWAQRSSQTQGRRAATSRIEGVLAAIPGLGVSEFSRPVRILACTAPDRRCRISFRSRKSDRRLLENRLRPNACLLPSRRCRPARRIHPA